ncbi:MAG TPA: RidA family protein [Candidatus Acidoferrales bacterium]|nr:RidA family protein [Candidatus Acidoferrales bacterium]
MTVYERLAALHLILPEVAPTHEFVAVNIVGDLAYISGHAPFDKGAFRYRGRIGRELDLADGVQAARLAVLGCLSSLERSIGSLDRVSQIIKLTGYVNCLEEFHDLPLVTDAASKVLLALFGGLGHARTTVGVASLPKGVAVEIDLLVRFA